MAKFCTRCGKKLEDGKPCSCVNDVVENSNNTNIDINKGFNDFIGLIAGIFVKPADTIKKYSKKDKWLMGVIILAVNCLIGGLLLYCLCLRTGATSLVSSIKSTVFGSSYRVPFIQPFFGGLFGVAFYFGIIAMGIFLFANVIYKAKYSIKETFALTGSCSIILLMVSILAILISFASAYVAMAFVLIGVLFYLLYLYQGVSDVTNLDKNKLIYAYTPAVVVATVILYIIVNFALASIYATNVISSF